MNRLYFTLVALLINVLVLAQSGSRTYLHADAIDRQVIPEDTALRTGTLGNGFTYYVIRNSNTAHRADMRLLVRCGSMLEKDNERGLTHFVEHMLFKGTRHFPGQDVIGFMRRNGIKFGQDSNAFTGYESVNYLLNDIPTDDMPQLDSCLLLLRDWACDATIQKEDVESERNVIVEEWRSKQIFSFAQQLVDDMMKGTPYARHNPIGDIDVVKNCTRKQVYDYYRHWYQPQNQAIVVTGDFDPDAMVEKVRKMFGGIKRGKNTAPQLPSLEENGTPCIEFYQDELLPCNSMALMYRLPEVAPERLATVGGQREIWMRERLKSILTKKLSAFAKHDADMTDASAARQMLGDIQKMSVFIMEADATAENWKPSFTKLLMMIENIRRNGFRDEDWKEEYSYADPAFNADTTAIMWGDTLNNKYINDFSSNEGLATKLSQCYFSGTRYLSRRTEWNINNYIANSTTEQQLHDELCNITEGKNLLIASLFPKSAALPSAEEVRAVYDSVRNMTDEELAEEVAENIYAKRLDKLMVDSLDMDITPGTVVKTTVRNDSTTEVLLSNGVKAILVKGRYDSTLPGKRKEIGVIMVRPSGLSAIADDDFHYHDMLTSCLRTYCQINGDMMVAIKDFADEFQFTLFDTDSIADASYMDKDFKEMYAELTCTEVDSVAFAEKVQEMNSSAAMLESPLGGSMMKLLTIYSEHPERLMLPTREDVAKLNIGRFREVVNEYHSNYNGSVLAVMGDFETDSIMPFILKYVGSLPSRTEPVGRKTWPADYFKTVDCTVTETFTNAVPLCSASIFYAWDKGFTYCDETHAHNLVLKSVLGTLLLNQLRVENSDVYTPLCSIDDRQYPFPSMKCNITFTCNPTEKERIVSDVDKILHGIADGTIDTNTLIDDCKAEYEKKSKTDRKNGFTELTNLAYRETGKTILCDDESTFVKKVTPASFKAYVAKMLSKGHRYVGLLTTE